MEIITLCAKFNLFSDNTALGAMFDFSNFFFESNSGAIIIVNETSGEKGITIDPQGVKIEFTTKTNIVYCRVGIWDGSLITAIARDIDGDLVAQTLINGHNQFIDFSLTGNRMKTIEFFCDGHEELIVSICINIDVCD